MYNFKQTEQKWRKVWKDNKTDKTPQITSNDRKCYVLEMLPYPSGKIHMGHVRNYSIGDAIARFKKAKGYKVLHPMGWDSFGMPAENAALKHKIPPQAWTNKNIEIMKTPLQMLGFSYDWEREISTCSEEYYGLEQQIFLDMYERDLVYSREAWINWDPVDNTILANEQVIDGCGWRSGAKIIKKKVPHWCLKITKYAEELLNNLDALEAQSKNNNGWPEKVLAMQRNWIGKSEGLLIEFNIDKDSSFKDIGYEKSSIPIFTTRPETLFGASFCAIASDHPLATLLATKNPEIEKFTKQCQEMPTLESELSITEKLGIDTGIKVYNPFNPSQTLPVFIANFVLMDYGTGAVFGCPAHDERDFEFATKYNLTINSVIKSDNGNLPHIELTGFLVNSKFLDGLSVLDARKMAIEYAEKHGLGKKQITYRLRDWTVSRQRYWGCPIPIIHCKHCGSVPVPFEDLPVKLPSDVIFDSPGNPLDLHPTWKHVKCPKCNSEAVRETDTLDTFFESSWYFLRNCCARAKAPIDESIIPWVPVDIYIGGIEHAVLHLLYARFFNMALCDSTRFGFLKNREPFKTLLTQGMVCHTSFKDSEGNWIFPHEVELIENNSYISKKTGKPVTAIRSEKMSKSKNNVIDPDEIIENYGADTLRIFILSDTPYDKDLDWNSDAIDGVWKYQNRMWGLCEKVRSLFDSCDFDISQTATEFLEMIISFQNKEEKMPVINFEEASNELRKTHTFLQKIDGSMEQFYFHKSIAFHREFTHFLYDSLNALEDNNKNKEILENNDLIEIFMIWIATIFPFAPHFALEAYEYVFRPSKIIDTLPWPILRKNLIKEDSVTIAVQVCGKLRATFIAPIDSSEDFLKEQSLALAGVQKYIEGKVIKKTIVVKNKLVSIVV